MITQIPIKSNNIVDMLILIIFVSLSFVLKSSAVADTKHCCLPEQFNGKLLMSSKFLDGRRNDDNGKQVGRFGIDFARQALYAHYRDYGKPYPIYWTIIADFQHAKALYLIDRLADICWETPLKAVLINRCLFNDENHRGTMPFINGLSSEVYTIPLLKNHHSAAHKFLSLLLIAKDTCLPIADQVIDHETDHKRRTMAAIFHEMSTSILSERLFDVPAICRQRPQRVPKLLFWPPIFHYIQSRFFPTMPPQRCCVPPQWTATINKQTFFQPLNGAKAGIQTSIFPKFYMDYTNHRFSGSEEVFVNEVSQYNGTFVAFLNNGITLYSQGSDGQCYKYIISDYKPITGQCLTNDSEYDSTISLGKGSNALSVNVWKVVKDTIFGLVPGKVYLTQSNCVPVMIAASGTSALNSLTTTITITDFEDSISDQNSVFAVPSGCSNPIVITTTMEEIEQIILSM